MGFFCYLTEEYERYDPYHYYENQIQCSHDRFNELLINYPVEMSIVLTYITTNERLSLSCAVLTVFPQTVSILKELLYKYESLNLEMFATEEFGISSFREFESRDSGKDFLSKSTVSQREIIESTLKGDSIIAILPTGGGKTFTFQMPALIKAQAYKALTVVISPLQALMKNHVGSFREKNQNYKIAAISGYLSPIERINTITEVENGIIDVIYLAPEALRSNSIFNALKKRIVDRFVIDEAHCFSSWGHDFRHDYKYIAKFIRDLQEKSPFQNSIPVSCLTATAKPEVLEDIRKYFADNLGVNLVEHYASANRTNLHYKAIEVADDSQKYEALVTEIVRIGKKSTIIYSPQNARQCKDLSVKPLQDSRIIEMSLVIEPFYSKIDAEIDAGTRSGRNKADILNDFIDDKIDIVIATTAFGMGIDKPNIEAVIHYETSDSLESYLQESGRGGRSSTIDAECIILYISSDFDKLFTQQIRSKIEYAEINRILKEIKKEKSDPVFITSKQLAEKVGFDYEDKSKDYDIIIKTALLELEDAAVISRGRNRTKIFASSVLTDGNMSSMELVHKVLDVDKGTLLFYDEMIRIMSAIVGRSKLDPIELDDLSDQTGVKRNDIQSVLFKLSEYKLIAMDNDISAQVSKKVLNEIKGQFHLETTLLSYLKNIPNHQKDFNLRELNDIIGDKKNNVRAIKKAFQNFSHLATLANKKFRIKFRKDFCRIVELVDIDNIIENVQIRQQVVEYVVKHLLELLNTSNDDLEFSSLQLHKSFCETQRKISIEGFHHTLVYMHESFNEFKLKRGRLIYYQAFEINKEERMKDAKPYQKQRDYENGLKYYYERKTESIHILKAFFEMLQQSGRGRCEGFVHDYFSLDYKGFKKAYGFNEKLIKLPITHEKHQEIIANLNNEQSLILNDNTNRAVLVLAGPGSGKTKTLVHKIASLITLENHKAEHFLMLTHGRAAANEFRTRLFNLIGGLAYEVEIMTFHAYALQLIGKKITDQSQLSDAIQIATEGLKSGELSLPVKTMLILDEYQDVSNRSYMFITQLFNNLEAPKKIIAVGDDDQCINNFNGDDRASVDFLRAFEVDFKKDEVEDDDTCQDFAKYHLESNYRSKQNLVTFTNSFAETIPNRLKSDELIAKNNGSGYIQIVNYAANTSMHVNLISRIVDDPSDNIAVICQKNDDVMTIYSELKSKGISVKYLTSHEGFRLGQLDELQFFIEQWRRTTLEEAYDATEKLYHKSHNLRLTQEIIKRFLDEYNTDTLASEFLISAFDDYLYNIDFDEFASGKAKVVVSTMHKSKGKEFETVYVMVENNFIVNDYLRRLLYVAITRAKENLYIHTQDSCFKSQEPLANDVELIDAISTKPKQIMLTMGLGDMMLGYSESQRGILKTCPIAGDVVDLERVIFSNGSSSFKFTKDNQIIGVLSKPNTNVQRVSTKIIHKENEGYYLNNQAVIEHVVHWKEPETKKNLIQVLCKITMTAQN